MDLNELMKNPDQIKSLITLLQGLLPSDSQSNNESDEEEDFTNTAIKTKGLRTRKKQDPSKNKFLSMPEKDMHKDDTAIDKLLCQSLPVARSREYDPIKVKCRVCGKEEEINPALVYDLREGRYKCNKCSTSSG